MFKVLHILCITSCLVSAATLAQAQDIETPEIEILDGQGLENEGLEIEKPEIESTIETSVNLGIGITDGVNFTDNGTTLELDDVKLVTYGLSAEKKLLREKDYSISAALSGEAGFGEGNNFQINGVDASGDPNYRRLQVYGDVIARYEAGGENSWTPFVAAGVGLVEERIEQDSQKFKALTPKTRFRAGIEKKLSDRVTFGVSAGKTVDLD